MGRPLLAGLLAGAVALLLLLQHALVGRLLLLPLYRGLGFRTVSTFHPKRMCTLHAASQHMVGYVH
jgi:hypothetical protein